MITEQAKEQAKSKDIEVPQSVINESVESSSPDKSPVNQYLDGLK